MSFRIMSGPEKVTFEPGSTMMPFVRYVLSAGPAQRYKKTMAALGMEVTMSVFNSYCRPYAGQDLNGKRLAFYRHSAFGDNLMATAVPVYLKFLFPQAEIDVYCAPKVLEVWRGLPVRAYPTPMIFEATRAYDFLLLYDEMLEEDREPEQENAFDNMFSVAGFRDVPAAFKVPKVVTHDQDLVELGGVVRRLGCGWPEKYLVYQLGAGNANRTYPPAQGGKFISAFLAAFPDWSVVVVGLDKQGAQQRELADALSGETNSRVLNLVNELRSFRSLIPIVQGAGMVVCPDSSIGHLAAAFPKVPVISLWGLFSPDDRVKYYTNHTPLWPREVCPHAPCHSHEFTLPVQKCTDAANNTETPPKWCNVLRAITPERILEMAKVLLAEVAK